MQVKMCLSVAIAAAVNRRTTTKIPINIKKYTYIVTGAAGYLVT